MNTNRIVLCVLVGFAVASSPVSAAATLPSQTVAAKWESAISFDHGVRVPLDCAVRPDVNRQQPIDHRTEPHAK